MSYMTTRTSSLNSFSYDFRPYPQPGPNALPSLTNLFPAPPRAPPPHVLPPTPPAVPLLPQHAPPPGPRRPITPDPDEKLKQLAMAALGPEVWAYRRIKKATVPKNSASGLPHFAPPAGPPPPSVVLPPVSALLERPPTAEETIKRIAEMDDDDAMSTSTVRAPNPGPDHHFNDRSPSVSRRSSTVTRSSDPSSGSQGHSQNGSRASPLSTSSTQSLTRKRHLFGDVGYSSKHVHRSVQYMYLTHCRHRQKAKYPGQKVHSPVSASLDLLHLSERKPHRTGTKHLGGCYIRVRSGPRLLQSQSYQSSHESRIRIKLEDMPLRTGMNVDLPGGPHHSRGHRYHRESTHNRSEGKIHQIQVETVTKIDSPRR